MIIIITTTTTTIISWTMIRTRPIRPGMARTNERTRLRTLKTTSKMAVRTQNFSLTGGRGWCLRLYTPPSFPPPPPLKSPRFLPHLIHQKQHSRVFQDAKWLYLQARAVTKLLQSVIALVVGYRLVVALHWLRSYSFSLTNPLTLLFHLHYWERTRKHEEKCKQTSLSSYENCIERAVRFAGRWQHMIKT